MKITEEFPNGDLQVSFSKMTAASLAKAYGVDKRTFSRWLQPFLAAIGPKIGYYYNTAQVKTIMAKLGLPDMKLRG